ncbi:Transcriptional regulator containing GAF, AAA-type ATPase, and DNA-binding Fis domains [Neorhodopirellula lusitana]|uniref:Transcriptional regulator containing GAF, AAA-type ATPase, and DNA-binding Fis domains n=1 Tax=Neorhodopirellula lusitana TaxID=445327 RepID=A0ABY1PXZ5_9BACT|nr:sigma 54-interacting transcriptional regulator [Neorhodopirellula lusitana]SMP47184.1 Transcriptional regulator containing GAF, AAA-type ATPase, and DNA-binding Fis domains [Neorhodopirellula lusitana]
MVAYLAVQTGQEKGTQYPLDPDRPMHIGRATGCEIMLSDPNSSRFHAVVYYEAEAWHLRDTDSRNGTLVNGQKADHVRLVDQTQILIGKTTLQLINPQEETNIGDPLSQTLYEDLDHWKARESDIVKEAGDLIENPNHLLDLYQLSLSLLHGQKPDDVIDTTLQLLCQRTDSDRIALVVDGGDGRWKVRRQFPKEKTAFKLDRNRLKRVIKSGNIFASDFHDKRQQTDSEPYCLMVPITDDETSLGVLILYRKDQVYSDPLIELVAGAAGLLASGLTQSTLTENLKFENQRIANRNADQGELIGNSKVMVKLKERIQRVGKASGSVLIRGESGAGKELVARAVHRASNRNDRPMLTVNCAAIPKDLLESQLFGHKRGSFTGADADHVGLFEQADQGTLFLDEIGEMTLEGQAKLLRILEGHPFLPVGASKQVNVDVRVIAATNRDLTEFVRDGRFREDLYYRLSVFELPVPPLRDRGEDIDHLISHFLAHFLLQHGRPQLSLSEGARKRMMTYPWPGNVRQLRNVIDSAVVMADEPEIVEDDLGLRDAGLSQIDTLRIDIWEKRLIEKALTRCSGSVPEAAKLLGISRATAYRKIGEYEIERT